MPEMAKYMTMYNPSQNDRRWGAAISRDGNQFRCVSAWGPSGGKLQHKVQEPVSAGEADDRFEKTHWAKVKEGYLPNLDLALEARLQALCAEPFPKPGEMTNLTIGDLNNIAKLSQKMSASLSTGGPILVGGEGLKSATSDSCGFCNVRDYGEWEKFRKLAICTLCSGVAHLHGTAHPHRWTQRNCTQFSHTPNQWATWGWPPNSVIVKQQANKANGCQFCIRQATDVDRPSLHVLPCKACGIRAGMHAGLHPHREIKGCQGFVFPNAESPECPNCILNSSQYTASQRQDIYDLYKCVRCSEVIGGHSVKHPHIEDYSDPKCPGVVFPPAALAKMGLARTCEFCDHLKVSVKEPFWQVLCQCGLRANQHVGPKHPHPSGGHHGVTCNGFVRKASGVVVPEVLADLPCDCRHWLNVHATQSEDTGSNRFCLVSTCGCSYYRRTCEECSEVTRNAWRHLATCITGMRERLTSGDAKPLPIIGRQPRSIADKLLDDW